MTGGFLSSSHTGTEFLGLKKIKYTSLVVVATLGNTISSVHRTKDPNPAFIMVEFFTEENSSFQLLKTEC